jgi:hypothetical protein
MMAALNQVPQLEEGTKRKAAAYVDGFFRDIATDADVQKRVLKGCIN